MKFNRIHALKDPWKFFTLVVFIVLTVLTVVSQLWILRTSVQEKGGAFTLRTGQADQPAEIEAETLSGFTVHQETPSVIALARAGHDFFSIDSSVPGQIILSSQTTSFGEPALELADVREPKQQRSGKSLVPALLAWALVLLALGQAFSYLFQ